MWGIIMNQKVPINRSIGEVAQELDQLWSIAEFIWLCKLCCTHRVHSRVICSQDQHLPAIPTESGWEDELFCSSLTEVGFAHRGLTNHFNNVRGGVRVGEMLDCSKLWGEVLWGHHCQEAHVACGGGGSIHCFVLLAVLVPVVVCCLWLLCRLYYNQRA